METKNLDGALFLSLMQSGAANLQNHAKTVDDLNVFPIPDGDTGENMTLTVRGGLRKAEEKDGETSLSGVSGKIAHGMVLGARGNSGVILSQFFAGIAASFDGIGEADVKTVGCAFQSGVRRAYEAVMKPTEGTMLTVAREAVEYACGRITAESTLNDFFADCLTEMNASLARTPELLAVLKEAGVIDSGGAGLFYLVEGMTKALCGEIVPSGGFAGTEEKAGEAPDLDKFTENDVMVFGYCTELLLRLQTAKTDVAAFDLSAFRRELESRGDSLVTFRTGTIVKIHIHTMHPGEILSFCQSYGEFLTVKIENMTLQHSNAESGNSKPGAYETAVLKSTEKQGRKPFGVVTVASGEGVKETLRQLGADVVIDGGQGNNPATSDFLRAFDEAGAETVFVLPNNGNILLAAKQAAALADGVRAVVVESRSIGDGYAALSMLNYDSGNAEEIAAELTAAMEGVLTGLVTKAVRDATLDGVTVKSGGFIGFCDKKMIAASDDKVRTAHALLAGLGAKTHEILIVIYGNTVTAAEKESFRGQVRADFSMTELYEIDGGDDGYDFQLILE